MLSIQPPFLRMGKLLRHENRLPARRKIHGPEKQHKPDYAFNACGFPVFAKEYRNEEATSYFILRTPRQNQNIRFASALGFQFTLT